MQIVGYRSAVEGPAELVIAEDGTVRRESLEPGRDVAYTLEERHCAGTVSDGRHVACDRTTAPYCPQHTDRWPCARCRGDCDLPLESCREEHAIYLAAFAPDHFKVGVTRSWRLETRLREQGADRAAHIRTVENGRIARQIETDIAESVGDSVRVDHKLAGIHQSVDETVWERLLADFEELERFTFDHGIELSERPVAETLLSGSVRGSKGRLLVLDHNGSTYGVDLRNLVGHEIAPGTTGRTLQASLGSFG
ncbi:DUF2797 domain-containing protein [Halorhabdus rudnickae]|uniref:DUF2797 domain-containing protein n=1 Tax=Halorhabdus rudnickae TaxID=1775544 RepID=UPI0010840720|nr:DUF2797 domain-containing protein [Halorhabdus rudnickae]